MRAICANPTSPLGETDFFRNQTGKLGVKEPVERTVELPPTWGWATFGTYDVPIAGINRLVNVRLEGLGEPFALDWIQLVPPRPEVNARSDSKRR